MTAPRITAESAVSLRASPRTSRTLCRASTRFARGARRTWAPKTSDRPAQRPSLLARLLGRRG